MRALDCERCQERVYTSRLRSLCAKCRDALAGPRHLYKGVRGWHQAALRRWDVVKQGRSPEPCACGRPRWKARATCGAGACRAALRRDGNRGNPKGNPFAWQGNREERERRARERARLEGLQEQPPAPPNLRRRPAPVEKPCERCGVAVLCGNRRRALCVECTEALVGPLRLRGSVAAWRKAALRAWAKAGKCF